MDINKHTNNSNPTSASALARAKRLAADIKRANDNLRRRTDELAGQAARDVEDLEEAEKNLKQTEIDAINKMDAAVFEFLSDEEK